MTLIISIITIIGFIPLVFRLISKKEYIMLFESNSSKIQRAIFYSLIFLILGIVLGGAILIIVSRIIVHETTYRNILLITICIIINITLFQKITFQNSDVWDFLIYYPALMFYVIMFYEIVVSFTLFYCISIILSFSLTIILLIMIHSKKKWSFFLWVRREAFRSNVFRNVFLILYFGSILGSGVLLSSIVIFDISAFIKVESNIDLLVSGLMVLFFAFFNQLRLIGYKSYINDRFRYYFKLKGDDQKYNNYIIEESLKEVFLMRLISDNHNNILYRVSDKFLDSDIIRTASQIFRNKVYTHDENTLFSLFVMNINFVPNKKNIIERGGPNEM